MRTFLWPEDQVKLWEAVNAYTKSCGGNIENTLNKSMLQKRMDCVVEVENAVIEILEKRMK